MIKGGSSEQYIPIIENRKLGREMLLVIFGSEASQKRKIPHIGCLPLFIIYQLPVARCLINGVCLYQVMMTLDFLKDVANDTKSTQKSIVTSYSLV